MARRAGPRPTGLPAWWGPLLLLCGLLFGLLWAGPASAHKPSDSYLTLAASGTQFTGRWDIALRDLDVALGLDADGDGNITWGEVRARHADIAALAQAHLVLRADGQACALAVGAQQVDEHTDGAYSVLPLTATCARAPAVLDIGYTLFADLDPQHRGLLSLSANGATRAAILGPQAPQQAFALAQVNRWQQFVAYAADGVWHIWIGFDHILFLLSLLLPAVGTWVIAGAVRGAGASRQAWQPVPRLGMAVWEVLRVVTAFTLAHSITLTLATLGWVSLPSRLVEATIAASVVLAALNNVVPFFQGRRWMVAFSFGLIHGFGFASVLAGLGLPRDALVLALLGFNLGVEAGQLAIVAVFLPLAYALRRSVFYRRVVLVGGSLLIAAVALAWFVERAFDLKLMPF
ncbi:MAG: HupE/UreJ family protein [Aquabacterium sp.]|nr:HupE/UreJ family protein [Aquabacterium sp.]